jgi:hypothetical protein|tara:strand:+ start:155 stop:331 length:177 start_codon:yes stop_codon:yes gene_type:complete
MANKLKRKVVKRQPLPEPTLEDFAPRAKVMEKRDREAWAAERRWLAEYNELLKKDQDT